MFRNAHLVLRLELAIPSLLGDTEEQATKRRIDAEHAMRRLFRYAVAVFGQEDASRIWTNVAKNPRGPRKGSRDPQRDRLILAFYDEGIRDCRSGAAIRRWPRRVGLWLAAADPRSLRRECGGHYEARETSGA